MPTVPCTDIRHFETYGFYHHDGLWWVLGQGVSPYFTFDDRSPHGRVMYGFYSEDLANWELYPKALFVYDVQPYFHKACLQNHVGAGVWNRGRVLIGLQGQFWPAGFSSQVRSTFGLIYSYDGITWREPFERTPILMPGDEGEWDQGMLLQVQSPVSRGDQTYVYYTGADSGNMWESTTALGLTTVHRDGLAAWEALDDDAALVTAPIRPEVCEDTVDINCAGDVHIQVLDRMFRPLQAEPVLVSQGVCSPAVDLSALSHANLIRLRFDLSDGAKLYGFELGSRGESRDLDEWQ
jgi:hypothetical protein